MIAVHQASREYSLGDHPSVSAIDSSSDANCVVVCLRELGEVVLQDNVCDDALYVGHCVPLSAGGSPHERFRALCNHIFRGECMQGAIGSCGSECVRLATVWNSVDTQVSSLCTALYDLGASSSFSVDVLQLICDSFMECAIEVGHRRVSLLCGLKAYIDSQTHGYIRQSDDGRLPDVVGSMFVAFDRMTKPQLQAAVTSHGLVYARKDDVERLRDIVVSHVVHGRCRCEPSSSESLCSTVREEHLKSGSVDDLECYVLSVIAQKARLRPLRRVLRNRDIVYYDRDSLGQLRGRLKRHISSLRKGKLPGSTRAEYMEQYRQRLAEQDRKRRDTLRTNWPEVVSRELKNKMVRLFRDDTSSAALRTFTCACCAGATYVRDKHRVAVSDLPLELLQCPEEWTKPYDDSVDPEFEKNRVVPLPSMQGTLSGMLLDPAGVESELDEPTHVALCKKCASSLRRHKLPALALANHTYLGPVPQELLELTAVEESMVALCCAKCWILQLREEENKQSRPGVKPRTFKPKLPGVQCGVRGHIIIHPQQPDRIESVLPLSLTEATKPICVIFVGSGKPTKEWMEKYARPLCVRRDKVQAALLWLKRNNPLYRNVQIDQSRISELPVEGIVPVEPEVVERSEAQEVLMSHYDPTVADEVDTDDKYTTASRDTVDEQGDMLYSSEDRSVSSRRAAFESVVITDVDGNAPPDKLRAAALRHFKRGGGHLEMPHDNLPQNEFFNPVLFPKVYPTLFPYGIGGFEDPRRKGKLSMKHHVKHLFNLADRRFQEHQSFMFTAFNVLQRRSILLHTSLRVKRSSFARVAKNLEHVSAEAIARVCQKLENNDSSGSASIEYDADERKVFELMREVKFVSHNVPASSAARLNMRNEMRGLMAELGLPSFFVTINPADVFNPLVKFLAGKDIDVDALLPEQVPNPAEQSILIAQNPTVAAKFFNLVMKSFIKNLLGYNNPQLDKGILGAVRGYYGCVEAQGRGSLHCHMLIWIEGSLNPTEIKNRAVQDGDREFADRLIHFLDDTISTSIPKIPESAEPRTKCWSGSLPPGPLVIRDIISSGEEEKLSEEVRASARAYDIHRLAFRCQRHEHGFTCYKYWKKGEPLRCRFDLAEDHTRSESYFDEQTGELCLRCLDGMVNNFNETILRAMRCNMDIKFIGSGESAKGVLYYITDYIAKAQLKTHVAYAALELAVKKLNEVELNTDDIRMRSKRLLRRCVYSILSKQELSAQQVMSYNLEYEDHFTSHDYKQLYWATAEDHLNELSPSPECYVRPQCTRRPHCTASKSVNNDAELSPHYAEDIEESAMDEVEDEIHDDHSDGDDSEDELDDIELVDEVTVSTDAQSGSIVPHGSQLQDYIYRPSELEDMSYWDFIAQTEKVAIKAADRVDAGAESEGDLEGATDDHVDRQEERDQCADRSIQILLENTSRSRLTFPFVLPHPEVHKKKVKLVHPRLRRIVVPIGPPLPRRDQVEIYARYSRAMLLLFKPWRGPDNLRADRQSWADAFDNFNASATDYIKTIMDNMQIIHECKENRDLQRRTTNHRIRPRPLGASIAMGRDAIPSDDAVESEEGHLLEHLLSIDGKFSRKRTFVERETDECMQQATLYDVFRTARGTVGETAVSNPTCNVTTEQMLDTTYEDEWRTTYDMRKNAWREQQHAAATEHLGSGSLEQTARPEMMIVNNDQQTSRQEYSAHESPTTVPRVVPGIRRTDFDQVVNDIVESWTLNLEQARAFRIVAQHSLSSGNDPLRILINGPGGTGKSRVINALREFFANTEQSRRFRLASYTGIAAKNIAGMTLHAGLPIGGRRSKQGGSAHQDLIAMWEGVDYLFIDEISMISCPMLAQISDALNRAKCNENAHGFGGINLIFAGDFAQLPPLGGSRLYTHVDVEDEHWATKQYGQSTVAGKILWNWVTTVVTLTQIMRQRGDANERFVQLLTRLREGKCTDDDYRLLNTRLLSKTSPDLDISAWKGAPIIVSNNSVKDALNFEAVKAYAASVGRSWHYYYAQERHKGKVVDDEQMLQHLHSLHSGFARGRLGRLPLVEGMRVLVCQNFDVQGGIVNGSIGILQRVRYTVDKEGKRRLTSCIIHLEDTDGAALPYLAPKEVPVLSDTADLVFTHPYSKKSMTLQRTQVPILPAYSMTAHKAQGQTFAKVIVDLQGCRGSEAPYVMLSRATSLDGVLILRPFSKSKITCNRSEDLRFEMDIRQPALNLQTIVATESSDALVEDAKRCLPPLAMKILKKETDRREATRRKRVLEDVPTANNRPRKRTRHLREDQIV